MKLTQYILLAALNCLFFTPLAVAPIQAFESMDQIIVHITNTSAFQHTYTIKMVGCRPSCCRMETWPITLAAHNQPYPLGLCSNKTLNDGYGEFYYHNESQGSWTHVALLRNGESHSM